MSNNIDLSVWKLIISRGLVSLGSALATFSLDVWIYQTTGSYSIYALIATLATVPPLLFALVAGFVVDRFNKARILITCELLSTCILLTSMALYLKARLHVESVALLVFLLATVNEFRYTALTALVPQVVSKNQLVAINGIQQAFRGLVVISGPLLGVAAYELLGLPWVLGICAVTNFYAIFATRGLKYSVPGRSTHGWKSFKDFLLDYKAGIQCIKNSSQLRSLLLFFAILNALISVYGALITPHMLRLENAKWLALVFSFQGAGLFLAGLVLLRKGARFTPEKILLTGSFGMGWLIFLMGITSQSSVVIAIAFLIGVQISLIASANQAIWQTNTPIEIQGKVIALRSMILYLLSPFAIYLSAPLLHYFYAPIMKSNSVISEFWGEKSGGVGLMISTLGVAVLLLSTCASKLTNKRSAVK